MNSDDPTRYCNQPTHIKLVRWLRHRPLSIAFFCYDFAWWICHGAKPCAPFGLTRYGMVRHMWMIRKSLAHCSMRNYWTTDELKKKWELL